MKRLTLVLILSGLISSSLYAQTIRSGIVNKWPDSRYTVNADDGTVTDEITGLMWRRCAEGQIGTTCDGEVTKYNWKEALGRPAIANAAGMAGHDDWRLPNIKELRSLVARDRYEPAINTQVFPNTPSDNFWSSSPIATYSSYAWVIDFGYGYDGDSNHSDNTSVRLVRGGQ